MKRKEAAIRGAERRVIAQCVGCGRKRKIKPGEIADNDMPMCFHCMMPMIAVRAERTKESTSD